MTSFGFQLVAEKQKHIWDYLRYTIFLKRLKDKNDSGTTVLMRYTLRLLTAQQFQRAAALICACDKIREENKEELGTAQNYNWTYGLGN